jgi:lysophospholipid acyltransferase (LPLAT)-like uncharacterized protein
VAFEDFLRACCLKRGVARILSWWIRFVFITGRWSILRQDIPESYHRQGRPFIICFWHNRLVMAPCAWVWDKPLFVLISLHPDAQLISSIVSFFGIGSVRGSPSQNGTTALMKMIRLLREGKSVGITPDGPRGPRYEVRAGIEVLARLAKADILPFTYAARRYRALRSWDMLRIAWPFTRGLFAWGEPITHTSLVNQTPEEARQHIEARLRTFSETIDKKVQ